MKQILVLVAWLQVATAYAQYENLPTFPEIDLDAFELVSKEEFNFADSKILQNVDLLDECSLSKFVFLYRDTKKDSWILTRAGYFIPNNQFPLRFEQPGKYALMIEQEAVARYYIEFIASEGTSKRKVYKQSLIPQSK